MYMVYKVKCVKNNSNSPFTVGKEYAVVRGYLLHDDTNIHKPFFADERFLGVDFINDYFVFEDLDVEFEYVEDEDDYEIYGESEDEEDDI